MKGKHYFNLDKITIVNVQFERETSYRWFPEIPARPKTFLGIKIGTTQAIPAGWNDKIDDDDNEYSYLRYCRRPTSYFKDYNWYRVDETAGRVYNKATVTVHLGYKEYTSQDFDSNEEAIAWAEEIVKKSGKPLEPIILT